MKIASFFHFTIIRLINSHMISAVHLRNLVLVIFAVLLTGHVHASGTKHKTIYATRSIIDFVKEYDDYISIARNYALSTPELVHKMDWFAYTETSPKGKFDKKHYYSISKYATDIKGSKQHIKKIYTERRQSNNRKSKLTHHENYANMLQSTTVDDLEDIQEVINYATYLALDTVSMLTIVQHDVKALGKLIGEINDEEDDLSIRCQIVLFMASAAKDALRKSVSPMMPKTTLDRWAQTIYTSLPKLEKLVNIFELKQDKLYKLLSDGDVADDSPVVLAAPTVSNFRIDHKPSAPGFNIGTCNNNQPIEFSSAQWIQDDLFIAEYRLKANDPAEVKEAERLLKEINQRKQMEITGDGNCLYRSVAVGLGLESACHTMMRSITLMSLKAIIHLVDSEKMIFTENGVNAYILEQSKDTAWGDNYSLYVLAKALDVRIVTHHEARNLISVVHPDYFNANRQTIYLDHSGQHYQVRLAN